MTYLYTLLKYQLILFCFLTPLFVSAQIDWDTETGLNVGDTFVDGQVINNFGGTGLNVRINVTVVDGYPSVGVNGDYVDIRKADDASFTLTILNGTSDLTFNNFQNTLDGEQITLSNPNSKNITIQEISNNGGGAMQVDGVNMPTGGAPNAIIGDDNVMITEQNNGIGTFWTASMETVTGFTWRYDVLATGSKGMEGFSLALSGTVLPIELTSFEVTPREDKEVHFSWETATETNNDYFTIERSKDGLDWKIVSRVDGQGTTSASTTYNYIDEDPFLGNSYYRLKQTDFDGLFSYSLIQSISLDKKTGDIKIYPNPSSDFITISNFEIGKGKEFFITDIVGKNLNNLITINPISATSYQVELSNLPVGIYFVRSLTAAKMFCKK